MIFHQAIHNKNKNNEHTFKIIYFHIFHIYKKSLIKYESIFIKLVLQYCSKTRLFIKISFWFFKHICIRIN